MKTILIVEDDAVHRSLLADIFADRYKVQTAGSLKEARDKLVQSEFDLVILDIGLPDGEGYKLCPYISKDGTRDTPIIFLTGHLEVDDKLLAFSLGARDYVGKPYDKRELMARVAAHLDRAKPEILRKGDLKFSLPLQRVHIVCDGVETPVDLTALEFKILLHFAKHEDHLLSRQKLIEAVWSDSVNVTDRTIDTHVSHIKKKLKASQVEIESVYGEGYRFISNTQKKAQSG